MPQQLFRTLLCFGETGTPSNRGRFSARCFGGPVRNDGVSLNARAISAFRLAGGGDGGVGSWTGAAHGLLSRWRAGLGTSRAESRRPVCAPISLDPAWRRHRRGEPDAGVPSVWIGGAGEGNPSCLVRQNNCRGLRWVTQQPAHSEFSGISIVGILEW